MQEWEEAPVEYAQLEERSLGSGWVIRVTSDCKLGSRDTTTPPTLPDVDSQDYENPQQVYSDFKKSVDEGNFNLYTNTITGETVENYGDAEGMNSWKNELEGYGYDRYEMIEGAWIWENGEKVNKDMAYIILKDPEGKEAKLLAMKTNKGWKIAED